MDEIVNSAYENLINSIIQDGYLKSNLLIEAFKAIDRKDFVLEEYGQAAYENAPLPIGFGQTISQPLTVAFMLELLGPKPKEKILEIGAGSGWQTAILAHIVSKSIRKLENNGEKEDEEESEEQKGKVIAIELIPELKEMAEKNVSKYNFIEKGVVKIIQGDGSKGCKEEPFYDKIISGAAAKGEIPEVWKKQLKIGGRIVSPINNSIIVIDKVSKNEYSQKEYFGFSFVPLVIE